MWTKPFRLSVIIAIYQSLFWGEIGYDSYIPDIDRIASSVSTPDEIVDPVSVSDYYNHFVANKSHFEEIVQRLVKDWDKTFPIIKAVFFTFLIEYPLLKTTNPTDEELKPFINKYVRTSQDFAGGDNPLFVHAIISKLLEQS